MTFTLDLVTPEKLLFSKDIAMVNIPGEDGDFGVLKDHSPVISGIKAGAIEIFGKSITGKPSERFFVASGFAEVTKERCTILAPEAINLAEIKKPEAAQRLSDAQKALSKERDASKKIALERKVAENEILVGLL